VCVYVRACVRACVSVCVKEGILKGMTECSEKQMDAILPWSLNVRMHSGIKE